MNLSTIYLAMFVSVIFLSPLLVARFVFDAHGPIAAIVAVAYVLAFLPLVVYWLVKQAVKEIEKESN